MGVGGQRPHRTVHSVLESGPDKEGSLSRNINEIKFHVTDLKQKIK